MTDETVGRAREATAAAPPVGDEAYRSFLRAVRRRMDEHWPALVEANERDLEQGRAKGLDDALLNRLRLGERHRQSLHRAVDSIERDLPRSAFTDETEGTGGLRVRRMLRPLGVVLMIFEARAEIAVRSAVMCAATGNAVLLRGGAEIGRTSDAVGVLLTAALADAGLPEGLVTIVDSSDRRQLRALLGRDDAIDVIIPRGSPSLIDTCRTASRIPLIASGGGVNHLYVHPSADFDATVRHTLDAKLTDPVACTALDMVLLDRGAVDDYFTALAAAVRAGRAEGLVLRLPEELAEKLPPELRERLDPAPLGEHDNGREYLSRTLAVRAVSGIGAAVEHIARYGSQHTEGVAAGAPEPVEEFCRRVDAAAIVVNGSLLQNDSQRMGTGASLAISTTRLHVRGQVTIEALLTNSWIVDGSATTDQAHQAHTYQGS